jgi:RNA polymerase sigma-70 factor (ECF subfamily)
MVMDPLDPDAALMVAFQRGDGLAFEQLLDKYHSIIVNFIYRIVNDRAEAEELAQEVFLRVYRARESYEPRARFAAWIYKIATNISLKAAARARRTPFRRASRDLGDRQHDFCEGIQDPRPNAERTLMGTELGMMVKRAVDSLPNNEKLALILRRYQDLSYREIATVMNCTESAVKTYLHRGKSHVRERLLPYVEKGGI